MIIDIEQDEGVTDATHNRLLREALRTAMKHHRDVTLGDHFKENAKTAPGGEYGYLPRSPRYIKRKRRKVGHNRPNFLYGRLARETGNSQITATAKRARMVIRGPGRAIRNQQRLELEAITRQEEVEIAQRAGDTYTSEANKPHNRRRRRRRIG